MAEKIQKNDFIELGFIGKTKEGNMFDTNIKEEAKKIGLEIEERPLIICIGQNMILPAIDEFLTDKELGNYILELTPEKAFGVRNRQMIKTMPIKIFHEKQVMPQPGMVFQFDTLLGRVSAVSGGRVIVDFNNPLAGKEVVYELNAKRIISEMKEKIETLELFFFRKKLDFTIENNNLKIKSEKNFIPLINFFKDKFKEILNLDMEAEEIADKPEAKQEKPQETITEK